MRQSFKWYDTEKSQTAALLTYTIKRQTIKVIINKIETKVIIKTRPRYVLQIYFSVSTDLESN